MWGTVLKRDLLGEIREEDRFHNKEELKEYLKSEIERQGENVSIRNLDASLVEDMSELFCVIGNDVKTLDLSGWDTSNVKNMGDMFYGCHNLKSLNLSGWDTSNVENMKQMFSYCSQLKSLDISGWDTSIVNNTSWMFSNCLNLESLDLSGWNTSNIKYMTGMFSDCTNLKSLNLSGWNISNVGYMYGIFNGCDALELLDLSGWDTYTDMHPGWTFVEHKVRRGVVDGNILKK